MNAKALCAASIGAVVGVFVWAGISSATGFEVGYVAWGIGVAVGGLAKAAGGEGKTMGLACALIALASIFCGKVLDMQWSAPDMVRDMVIEQLTPEIYDHMLADAKDFSELDSVEQHKAFMVSHEYTERERVEDVSNDELEYFRAGPAETLRRMLDERLGFEQWRRIVADKYVSDFMANVSPVEMAVENLGVIDVLFAVLGIASAYKLGSGREEQVA